MEGIKIIYKENPVHDWFGLTYANWLTVPRVIMESMPLEWQQKMVALLEEMDEEFDWGSDDGAYQVSFKKNNGRFAPLPLKIQHYRRGTAEHMRRKSS